MIEIENCKISLCQPKEQGIVDLKMSQYVELINDLPLANASVMFALLRCPDLLPQAWKGKRVFFWGTTYQQRSGWFMLKFVYFVEWSEQWKAWRAFPYRYEVDGYMEAPPEESFGAPCDFVALIA
jgi:hypothetical protein